MDRSFGFFVRHFVIDCNLGEFRKRITWPFSKRR
jgi:hypothetical protein